MKLTRSLCYSWLCSFSNNSQSASFISTRIPGTLLQHTTTFSPQQQTSPSCGSRASRPARRSLSAR